ncbi:MAG: hypothetical protein Q9190_001126 [Brigantiaea leucoxantha]
MGNSRRGKKRMRRDSFKTVRKSTKQAARRGLKYSSVKNVSGRRKIQDESRKRFPLLSLPPELRRKIYNYVLSWDYLLISRPGSRNASALLRVNRQIYSESVELFYHENAFTIDIGGANSVASSLIRNFKLMRQCYVIIQTSELDEQSLPLLDSFTKDLHGENELQCLLIDIRTCVNNNYQPGIDYQVQGQAQAREVLQLWETVRQIHLVQIIVDLRPAWGSSIQSSIQQTERLMMSSDGNIVAGNGWNCMTDPQLSIDLAGPELEQAKKLGNWQYLQNDLCALFGLRYCTCDLFL